MNNRIRLTTCLILILPALLGAVSTDKVVKRIIEIGRTDNRTEALLDVLANRIGGRPIGSAAYDNAAEWAGRMFKEWGMQVVYQEAGELAVGFDRGPWFGKMTSPYSQPLHFATPSYSSGTRGCVAAPAVNEPKDEAQFKQMKLRLNGAWVLLKPDEEKKPDPQKPQPSYQERQREREETHKKWQQRLKKLQDAGALGVISSAKLPINALYNRDVHAWKSWADLPKLCDIRLDEHQFAEISRMIEERQRVELEFDIRNHFRMGPVKYHNVLGIIPGTQHPDEYVIMGGHLDSYDVASGAVDNGNGVTTSMEAARLIMAAGGKPKRTIIVGLWAGEEFGMLGSQHWVKTHQNELSKISAMFNRDGGPTVPTGLRVSEAMWKDMEKVCTPVQTINPEFPFELIKREAGRKPEGPTGSDSSVFAMHGVPALGFSTGDPKGYDFRYGEIWHTENDYFQKSIPEYQAHASIVTAVVVYGIADLGHLLSREGFYLPDEKPAGKAKENPEP